jgi:hypothetical protein
MDEMLKKYKAFLISVEMSGEVTNVTFAQFKEEYLKAKQVYTIDSDNI